MASGDSCSSQALSLSIPGSWLTHMHAHVHKYACGSICSIYNFLLDKKEAAFDQDKERCPCIASFSICLRAVREFGHLDGCWYNSSEVKTLRDMFL